MEHILDTLTINKPKHVYLNEDALSKYEETHHIPGNIKKKIAKYIVAQIFNNNNRISILDAGIGHGGDVLIPLLIELINKNFKKIEVYGFDNSDKQLEKLIANLNNFINQNNFHMKHKNISKNSKSAKLEIEKQELTQKLTITFKIYNFDFDVETKFFNQAIEFDLIIAEYLLHHLLNWRIGLIKLLKMLKIGGCLIMSERKGDIALLDGNFKGFDYNKKIKDSKKGKFYEFISEYFRRKNEFFYWNPEIQASDYSNAENFLSPFFEIHRKEFTYKYGSYTIKNIIEWIEKKVYTHFWIGIEKYEDSFIKLFEKYSSLNNEFSLEDGQEIIIFKNYKGAKPENLDYWMTRPILDKINYPVEFDFYKIGKFFLELMSTHDMFFPKSTTFIGIHPWDIINEKFGEPIQLAINLNAFEPKNRILDLIKLIKKYVAYIKYTIQIDFSISEFMFHTMVQKFPVFISIGDTTNIKVNYNRMLEIESLNIIISKEYINKIKYEFFAGIDNFIENHIKTKMSYLRSDLIKIDLDKNFFEECFNKISIKTINDSVYSGLIKELKNSIFFREIKIMDNNVNLLNKLAHSILGLATFYLTERKILKYLPSKSMREYNEKLQLYNIKGFGGLILYERSEYAEDGELKPYIKNIFKNRDEILCFITNFLFLKIGIINWSNKNKYTLKKYSTRSAIAAIMSRNSSHNIGSHVLSRIATKGINGWTEGLDFQKIVDGLILRKNILEDGKNKVKVQSKVWNKDQINQAEITGKQGKVEPYAKDLIRWSKDVQLLARYIQQRLDFIAQISTEWPEWSEPAYLLKDLLRWFLHQKHLLNYIAASENLGATLFDENGMPINRKNDTEIKEDIRIHIFMVPQELWNKPVQTQKGSIANAVKERKHQIIKDCLHSNDEQERNQNDLKCKKGKTESEHPCEDCHRILLEMLDGKMPQVNDELDVLLAIPGGLVGYHALQNTDLPAKRWILLIWILSLKSFMTRMRKLVCRWIRILQRTKS